MTLGPETWDLGTLEPGTRTWGSVDAVLRRAQMAEQTLGPPYHSVRTVLANARLGEGATIKLRLEGATVASSPISEAYNLGEHSVVSKHFQSHLKS